jgi:hypothetical protein
MATAVETTSLSATAAQAKPISAARRPSIS